MGKSADVDEDVNRKAGLALRQHAVNNEAAGVAQTSAFEVCATLARLSSLGRIVVVNRNANYAIAEHCPRVQCLTG